MFKRIYNFASSITLFAVLLGALILACAFGTIHEEQREANEAVYHTWWFVTLLVLFTVNLAACTFKRLRVSKKLPGFLAVHAGVLLVCVGGFISAAASVSGRVQVFEGKTVNSFSLDEPCEFCAGTGFTLAVNEATGERGEARCPECGGDGRKKLSLGFELTLEDFQIEHYPPRLGVLKFETNREGMPNKMEIVEFWRVDRGETVESKSLPINMEVIEIYSGNNPAKYRNALEVTLSGATRTLETRPGMKHDLPGGVVLKILERFRDLKRRDAPQAHLPASNPALRIKIESPAGEEERWLFPYRPDLESMHNRKTIHPGIKTEYMFNEEIDRGMLVKISGEGSTRKALLTPGRSHYPLSGGYSVVCYDQGGRAGIKAFKSHVSAVAPDGETSDVVIRVNHPLVFKGWKVYQSGYDSRFGAWSLLQVRRDPGVTFVYFGYALLFMGLVYVSFFYPSLVKRRKE